MCELVYVGEGEILQEVGANTKWDEENLWPAGEKQSAGCVVPTLAWDAFIRFFFFFLDLIISGKKRKRRKMKGGGK